MPQIVPGDCWQKRGGDSMEESPNLGWVAQGNFSVYPRIVRASTPGLEDSSASGVVFLMELKNNNSSCILTYKGRRAHCVTVLLAL